MYTLLLTSYYLQPRGVPIVAAVVDSAVAAGDVGTERPDREDDVVGTERAGCSCWDFDSTLDCPL